MARKRSEEDRKPVEINEGRLEGVGPSFERSVEDGPGLQHVVALKTNASQVAGCAVEAVAAHYPAGFYLVAAPVALDFRQDTAVRIHCQPNQPGGSIYLATVLMEIT